MTRNQLHIAFKIEMDKNSNNVAFGSYPAFLPEEIDYWLNKAMYQVISNKFTGNNALKQPFEGSVKRIHDLEKLIVTEQSGANKQQGGNSIKFVDAFEDKLFYVDCTLTFNDKKASVILIEHENAKNFAQTYNNIPWIEKPVAVIENNDLIVYYDPVSMDSETYTIDLTCVKQPTVITSTTSEIDEFPESVLYEIVDRAVMLALENVESNRNQTKSQLNQIDE